MSNSRVDTTNAFLSATQNFVPDTSVTGPEHFTLGTVFTFHCPVHLCRIIPTQNDILRKLSEAELSACI
jgi:hypothetical protein